MRIGLILTLVIVCPLAAQQVPPPVLSGRVTVVAVHDSVPIEAARVRLAGQSARTDASGRATIVAPPGTHRLAVARIGFVPFAATLDVRAGQDTAVTVTLEPVGEQLEAMVVQATRSERRIEDEPLRVEVLAEEEIEEKVQMTPGDITMMLNESSGLRVVVTSPSLGGANVRIQGMRGRYTQILADGLPLFGGQTGSLGLLQIPPIDLGGVEIIKGVASSLYGGSAMGGVINLVSRQPGPEPLLDVLLNQTSRGGSDAAVFASGRLSPTAGYTLLAGAHRQTRGDVDGDGWTDIPSYRRGVIRPRLFWSGASGATLMATAGTTLEEREGGTMPGRVAPDSAPYPEALTTRRYDAGLVSRWPLGALVASLRGSASLQSHHHTFGARTERDQHVTWFTEATLRQLSERASYVGGVALQQERYRAQDVDSFDFVYTTPGLFVQWTGPIGARSAAMASARLDRHPAFGSQFTYRMSLLRPLSDVVSARFAFGSGYFAPTPFTEESEVVGLGRVEYGIRRAERALNATADLAGAVGNVEWIGTAFWTRVTDAVVATGPAFVTVTGTGTGGGDLQLSNGGAVQSYGIELLARIPIAGARWTASYTRVVTEELLTPAHQAGMVIVWESERRGRVGLEAYYVGRQRLFDPYRTHSVPNIHIGVLVERRFGPLRMWLNGENLLDFRQTRYAPLVRPTPGLGGRWTTDVWGPLEGRTFNFGVKYVGK